MGRVTAALALAGSVSLGATAAAAQTIPSLELRGFYPPTDPMGSLYLEPASTPAAGEWNVGAFVSYARNLVVLEDLDGEEVATPLKHQLSLDYLGSIGLGARIALGLSVPTAMYQTGDDVTELLGAEALPRTAIGDLAFTGKAALVPIGELGGYGLAVLGRVTAPTGDRRSYLGDGATTGELRLLAEANLLALAFRATAGFRGRAAERTYVDETFSHVLPWGVGLEFKPRVLGIDNAGRWLWLAEVHGSVAATPDFAAGPQSPTLGGLAARYTVDEVSAMAGVELPIGNAVGTPQVRFVLGVGWAPRFYDQDGDGIEDDADECPEYPEDFDGFEDRDGCMDWDNDDDGVGDDEDRCPGEAEDADTFQVDGCPDPDNDGDGILDAEDRCPDVAGPEESHARGCPPQDSDGDGIFDHLDRCPQRPEDRDEFRDEDGCPDNDNDNDRIRDVDDACPQERGPRRSQPELNGCPSPDADGDTFDDRDDRCPKQPEDFDGVDDQDGCPDPDEARPGNVRSKPLIQVEERAGRRFVHFRTALDYETTEGSVRVAEASLPVVRAMAQLLNQHPRWVMMVGVKPAGAGGEQQQQALYEAFACVQALRSLTHRDEVAESVGWGAVSDLPGARARGTSVLVTEKPKPHARRKLGKRKRSKPPKATPAPAPPGSPSAPPDAAEPSSEAKP